MCVAEAKVTDSTVASLSSLEQSLEEVARGQEVWHCCFVEMTVLACAVIGTVDLYRVSKLLGNVQAEHVTGCMSLHHCAKYQEPFLSNATEQAMEQLQ